MPAPPSFGSCWRLVPPIGEDDLASEQAVVGQRLQLDGDPASAIPQLLDLDRDKAEERDRLLVRRFQVLGRWASSVLGRSRRNGGCAKRLASWLSETDHVAVTDEVLEWLMAGDPAVRWQTERDVLDADLDTWNASRSEVETDGWGRRLLDLQDPAGTWGGGIYTPKWTSTTYTLLLLQRFGLPPSSRGAIAGCRQLFDEADWVDGGVSYWASHQYPERCVNGMVLALGSYFDVADRRVDAIAGLLIDAAMPDGGWNCRDFQGASHSSFHTTISVLEGLLEWKRSTGSDQADTAITRGHEFMLDHRLYRSHRTGRVINDAWTTFHFPPRWHYDVLRGLDHLRDAAAGADPRAADAIEIVESSRRPDGRWGKGSQYSGEVFFPLEPGRVAGRWNTLRALRVLRWWNAAPEVPSPG